MRRAHDFGFMGSLLDWFLNHGGPDLLWRQWCPGDQTLPSRTIIRESIVQEFESIDDRRKNILLQSSWNHRNLVHSFPAIKSSEFARKKSHNPGPYLYQYTRLRRVKLSQGIEDPPETLQEVPFFTDIRVRPEEDISIYGSPSEQYVASFSLEY